MGWWFIALAAGAGAAVAWRAEEPTAYQLLARMDRFVAHAESVQLRGSVERVTWAHAIGAATDTHEQYTAEGSRDDHVGRLVITADDRVTEYISTRDRTVVRTAPIAALLPLTGWQPYEAAVPGGFDNWVLNGTARSRAIDPVVVGRDGDRAVLQFGLPLAEIGGEAFQIRSYEAEVRVGTDGEPSRLVLRVTSDVGKSSSDYELSHWGEPTGVSFPSETDVDAAASPQVLPPGWTLDAAANPGDSQAQENCPSVALSYASPGSPGTGGVHVTARNASCAQVSPPAGATLFNAGPYEGWVAVDGRAGTTAQISIEGTVVDLATDLSPGALAGVLADLAGLDLSKLPLESMGKALHPPR